MRKEAKLQISKIQLKRKIYKIFDESGRVKG